MDSYWVNNRPGYRCRHGHTSARTATTNRAPNLYIREDHAAERIRAILTARGLLPLAGAGSEDPQQLGSIARNRETERVNLFEAVVSGFR
jgi:hypothetical protein